MLKINKFVGIDVAKSDFYACFEENGDSEKFDNNKNGIGDFFNVLKRRNLVIKRRR